MAGTPPEDLLGWLEREEVEHSVGEVADALGDITRARELFYDELGYDLTEEQFSKLQETSYLRYEELPSISVHYELYDKAWGRQLIYRDIVTGRFLSQEDVYSLLATIR